MEFSIVVNWMSSFKIISYYIYMYIVFVVTFYLNFNEFLCKQTVLTLIRGRVLHWVCTVAFVPE